MRKLLALVLGFGALVGSIFVFAAIGDLFEGDPKHGTGVLVGVLVFFAGITASTGYGALRLWRGPSFQPEQLEHPLLMLASQQGGRLTVAEAAVGLKVPLKRARLGLDHLVTGGAAETLVSDSGELVYSVNGLLGAPDKATAKGVLES